MLCFPSLSGQTTIGFHKDMGRYHLEAVFLTCRNDLKPHFELSFELGIALCLHTWIAGVRRAVGVLRAAGTQPQAHPRC